MTALDYAVFIAADVATALAGWTLVCLFFAVVALAWHAPGLLRRRARRSSWTVELRSGRIVRRVA